MTAETGRPETLLAEILLANGSYLKSEPVPRPRLLGESRLLVVTCMDPRLTTLLPAAMGVGPEEMIQVRIAGNRALSPEADPVRSVVAALVLDMAGEVLVVGHTDCVMAKASTVDLLDGMQKMDLPREAFGGQDIRSWFGTIASERSNAIEAAGVIRESPYLPPAVPVHSLLIDTQTGKIEALEEGYSRVRGKIQDFSRSSGPVTPYSTTGSQPEAPRSSLDPMTFAQLEKAGKLTEMAPIPEMRPMSSQEPPPRSPPPPRTPPPPRSTPPPRSAPPPRPAPPPPPPPRKPVPPPPPPRTRPPPPPPVDDFVLEEPRKPERSESPFERAEDVLERLMRKRKR
jgi:carbonic anhydrase